MSAPVIVCLHGLGRSPSDWDGVRAGLEKFGRVVAPALPRDTRRAEQIASAATPDGAILVGHSLGAVLALFLAADRGNAVRGVVASSPFFPPARNGRSLPTAMASYAGHRVAFLRGLGRQTALVGSGSRGARGLGFLVRSAAHASQFRARLNAVAAAVLVVHAVDDHYVPLDFVVAAAAARPAWQLSVLAQGGHHPHVSDPQQWLAVVGPWLERLSPRPDED